MAKRKTELKQKRGETNFLIYIIMAVVILAVILAIYFYAFRPALTSGGTGLVNNMRGGVG
ncbi:MAG: hypothetical protein Q8O89_05115 [Nanoarchaeota archaeon]|nr:hypothetical protein [Nanoarchaeota archaeon]